MFAIRYLTCAVVLLSSLTIGLVSAEVYDFTHFEDKIVPKWLDLFAIDFDSGVFSFDPHGKTPDLYGTIDVAHVLGSIGQLDDFTEERRDAWTATINSYQNSTGFYHTPVSSPGTQPYHSAGESTATLALLDRKPRYNNSAYIALAEGSESEWNAFFYPLIEANGTRCYKESLGGNDIHGCGQIIGSVASVLAYTTGAVHLSFLRWWAGFIANNTDPRYGVVCPIFNSSEALYECLGGGMATHGIELGLGLGFNLSNPEALLSFALKMQDPSTGYWHGSAGSMTLDGMFQVTRSSVQMGHAQWNDAVKTACTRLLTSQEKELNDDHHVLTKYSSDSHGLPNVVAAVAECAMQFPELVQTRRKWSCCARYV